MGHFFVIRKRIHLSVGKWKINGRKNRPACITNFRQADEIAGGRGFPRSDDGWIVFQWLWCLPEYRRWYCQYFISVIRQAHRIWYLCRQSIVELLRTAIKSSLRRRWYYCQKSGKLYTNYWVSWTVQPFFQSTGRAPWIIMRSVIISFLCWITANYRCRINWLR